MREFWLDQGFLYNPKKDLYEEKCPKCQGTITALDVGFTCTDCDIQGTPLDWLWKFKGFPLETAEKRVKYFADTKEEDSLNSNKIAERLMLSNKFIYHNSSFYSYLNGVYVKQEEIIVDKIVKNIFGIKFKSHSANEVRNALAVETFVPHGNVNKNKKLLNFKNCLLDLDTLKIQEHSPEIVSTVQLNIEYDINKNCPLWEKTLNEIFEGDKDKILLLQQFMGYCLTPDNTFQTALLNVGEGSNGKSIIMWTLQNILGQQNYSTVQLSDFGNRHYIACMVNKLANISIESDNKFSINDANFKAIITGDEINVEEKYKPTYQTRLFCKLIFTMNDLPRVDDKTDAFFRRLKILRYNKQFKKDEDNRNLKFDLMAEYSGIVNWMIFGMKNLYKHKGFVTNEQMEVEVLDYRKENNNVYAFAEECLAFDDTLQCSKKDIYARYCKYCGENGYKPFAIKKMGKELKKIYPNIKDFVHPSGVMRCWKNVGILTD